MEKNLESLIKSEVKEELRKDTNKIIRYYVILLQGFFLFLQIKPYFLDGEG